MAIGGKVVVVGDDFGPMGDDAIVEGLTQLASGGAAMLHVAHVYDPSELIGSAEKRVLESEEELLAETPALLLQRLELVAGERGFPFDATRVKVHVRLGKPVGALLQLCADYEADLLVLGTHGRRGVDRLLMGSVAEELVRSARCPVLVARAKNYEGIEKTARPDPAYKPGEAPKRGQLGDDVEHVVSTTYEGWTPSDNGPTGFRIV